MAKPTKQSDDLSWIDEIKVKVSAEKPPEGALTIAEMLDAGKFENRSRARAAMDKAIKAGLVEKYAYFHQNYYLPEGLMAKVGDVVEVHFMDHVEDHHKPLDCVVWGKVVSQNKECLVVVSWDTKGKHNRKRWALVRSTITDVQVMVPE